MEEIKAPIEEVKAPEVKKPEPKKSNTKKFVERTLKVINEWPDGAKKKAAAARVLRNLK